MTENERKAIVEGPQVYLHDGLKCALGGYLNPDYCTVTSSRPGFWGCSWERVKEVQESESKRFGRLDLYYWRTSNAWLGHTPRPEDYQTLEDYERASR